MAVLLIFYTLAFPEQDPASLVVAVDSILLLAMPRLPQDPLGVSLAYPNHGMLTAYGPTLSHEFT